MTQISITRALAEVKLIESKLNKQQIICDVEIGSRLSINPQMSKTEVEASSKASMDHIADLFKRRSAIKKAIAKANIETDVTVKGETMSLIEAIDYKASAVILLRQYQNFLEQFNKAQTIIDNAERKIETEVSNKVDASYGSNQQTGKTLVLELTEQYKKIFGGTLISATTKQNVENLISDIQEKVAEIDMCLSEKNASTLIDV